MITEDEAEVSVHFLQETAKQYGQMAGYLAFADANLRRVKSLEMLKASFGSVADREATAYASDAYLDAIRQLQNATADVETLRAQRDAAKFNFECWRSENSGRKAGL